MPTKFGRNYQVQIDCDSEIAIIKPPFTIEFSITRTVQSSANTMVLKIYNLAPITRQKIFQDRFNTARAGYRKIEVRAGYGDDTPIIFQGNIQFAYSYRQRTEWITEINAWDSGNAYANSFSNFTVSAGIPQQNIISKLFVDLPGVQTGIISQYNASSARARTYLGNTTDLLHDEVKDGNFFIDNGRAFALKAEDAYTSAIEVLEASTGLLGTPRRHDAQLDIDVLFEPHIAVGQFIQLNTIEKMFSGLYKVMGFAHQGIISDAVNGQCKTSINLWFGPGRINIIDKVV